MKRISLIVFLSSVLFSCKLVDEGIDTHHLVNPDPVFSLSGVQQVFTVKIYNNQDHDVVISRTYGLSQPLDLRVTLDEQAVEEFNELNGSDYLLLPSDIYSFPSELSMASGAKSATFKVTFNPRKLYDRVGGTTASGYLLPLRISYASADSDIHPGKSLVMLNLSFEDPTMVVEIPPEQISLDFINGVAIKQTVELNSTTNFTTLDVSKIAFTPNASLVADYNTLHGTTREMLPAGSYAILEDVFDSALNKVTSKMEFECSAVDPSKAYVIPLEMKSTDPNYVISQDFPIYILVDVTEMKVSIDGSADPISRYTNIGTQVQGTLRVRLNAPILDPMPVHLNYDQTKVAQYNTANSTSYLALPAGSVTVPHADLAAQQNYVDLNYTCTVPATAKYDEDYYLVPLVLDQSALLEGTVVTGNSTVYLIVGKTITGQYTNTSIIGALSNKIGLAVDVRPEHAIYGKYICDAWGMWSWGITIDLTSLPFEGDANKRAILVRKSFEYGGTEDQIIQKSYLDLTTGEVLIDHTFLNGSMQQERMANRYTDWQQLP